MPTKLTDELMNTLVFTKIMALPEMRTDHDSDFIMESDCSVSYIKFMSTGGVTDDHNGAVLSNYLRSKGCVINQTRPRSMMVHDADIVRLFCN